MLFFKGFPGGASGKEPVSQCRRNKETRVQSLGWEDSHGVGNGNPFQYFCLKNYTDRWAWQSTVHRVAESDTTEATYHTLHSLIQKPKYHPHISEVSGTSFPYSTPPKALLSSAMSTYMHAHSLSCVWLCDSMDCSLPGSSVHGILQAKILEWVAISFSRGASQSRDWLLCHWQADSLPLRHLGSPLFIYTARKIRFFKYLHFSSFSLPKYCSKLLAALPK